MYEILRTYHVVTAGVHHRCRQTIYSNRRDGARVRQRSFLKDGQGIHVGSEQNRLSGAIFEDAGEAMAADSSVKFEEIEFGEVHCAGGGRFNFLVGQLGVRVKVLVESFVRRKIYECCRDELRY